MYSEYMINEIHADGSTWKLGRFSREEAKEILKDREVIERYASPFDWDTEIIVIK